MILRKFIQLKLIRHTFMSCYSLQQHLVFKKHIHTLRIAVIIIFITNTINTIAQTDNYWGWGFNMPSTLLAGAVVGGGAGASSIYYNPALIEHDEVPAVSMSANLVSLQWFRGYDLAGEGVHAKEFFFRVQPRFISYTFSSKDDKWGFEAAILTPSSVENQFRIENNTELDLIRRTEGQENYSGYLKYRRKFSDTWAGFGASRKINDNLHLGASTFFSVKSMAYNFTRQAEASQSSDSVLVNGMLEPKYIASTQFTEELDYWYLSFIFKLGAQYISNDEHWAFGLNITTPALPVYGEAMVRKTFHRSNVYDNSANQFTSNESFIDHADKSRIKVKHPFSLAIGCEYISPNWKNRIMLTAEYFHSIDTYSMTNFSQTNNPFNNELDDLFSVTDFMSYYHNAESLTNLAFGFKQNFSDQFFFLGGFRTDFTSGSPSQFNRIDNNFKVSQIHLDKFHLSGGPVFQFKKLVIITGAQLTWGGADNVTQIINFSNPVEYNPQSKLSLQGDRSNSASIRTLELALFFALSVDL